jgi:hypothetical protein
MKTIIIAYWHGSKYPDLHYQHSQEIAYSEKARNEIINTIINAGYSAMIRPFDPDGEMIIWIDKNRFGQK